MQEAREHYNAPMKQETIKNEEKALLELKCMSIWSKWVHYNPNTMYEKTPIPRCFTVKLQNLRIKKQSKMFFFGGNFAYKKK